MNLAWAFAFNILINSLLTFLTVALLTKLLVWAFRIRQPRIEALCLYVPLFKIGLDLLLYDFCNWALLSHINPLECPLGTRRITAMFSSTASFPIRSGVFFNLENGKTFTPADIIVLSVDPLWVKIVVLIVFGTSAVLCGFRLLQWFKSKARILQIIHHAVLCYRSVGSTLLKTALLKSNATVLISHDVDVPCAIGFRKLIILPCELVPQLSQGEFEAILAHELNHLRWRDSYLRMVQNGLCTFFWWIPTRWWRARIEQAQEYACDLYIHKFNISPIDLAQAMTKSAKTIRTLSSDLPILCFVKSGAALTRIKALFDYRPRALGLNVVLYFLIGGLLWTVLFGQFWIF